MCHFVSKAYVIPLYNYRHVYYMFHFVCHILVTCARALVKWRKTLCICICLCLCLCLLSFCMSYTCQMEEHVGEEHTLYLYLFVSLSLSLYLSFCMYVLVMCARALVKWRNTWGRNTWRRRSDMAEKTIMYWNCKFPQLNRSRLDITGTVGSPTRSVFKVCDSTIAICSCVLKSSTRTTFKPSVCQSISPKTISPLLLSSLLHFFLTA